MSLNQGPIFVSVAFFDSLLSFSSMASFLAIKKSSNRSTIWIDFVLGSQPFSIFLLTPKGSSRGLDHWTLEHYKTGKSGTKPLNTQSVQLCSLNKFNSSTNHRRPWPPKLLLYTVQVDDHRIPMMLQFSRLTEINIARKQISRKILVEYYIRTVQFLHSL